MEAKEIEIGMHAYSKRSRDYGFGKIVRILPNGFAEKQVDIQYDNDYKVSFVYSDVNASHDILDLIEKDDIVAYYNKLQDVKGLIIERVEDNNYIKRLREFVQAGTINIVRVMTHEQFEQGSYKIGG